MNYKKKLADLKQAMEIPFWKSRCKTSSKISSFRTLQLGKIANITLHLQLINQSKIYCEEFRRQKMGSQSLSHRKNFQCTWNAFWAMSTLVQSSGKKREILCPKLGNLRVRLITITLYRNEKPREGCSEGGMTGVWTLIKQ